MPSDADPQPQPVALEPTDAPSTPSLPPAPIVSLVPPPPPVPSLPALLAAAAAAAPPPVLPAVPPPVPASTAFLCVVSLVALVADLSTKAWAKEHLSGYDTKAHAIKRIEVLKGHVDFIFAQNPGGAWSFLRSLPDSLRRPFFLVVSAAAIVFIVSIYQRVRRDQRAMKWGLPLALGGAMGNLADRIRYGWVVDFIDFSVRWGGHEHHWPTFNVADIAIVLGVGLMAIDMLRTRSLHAHDEPGAMPGLSASR